MPFAFNPITGKLDLTGVGGGGSRSYKTPTGVATTTNLIATYDNGIDGNGATLTNSAALSVLSIDGVNPSLDSRVLVKNQTNTFENGIYIVTDVGSVSDPWVLTRAEDYNQPAEVQPGDLVPVSSGAANGSTIWEQVEEVSVIGTDPINFVIFTARELSISPYIVGDQQADFTDLQAAITKAVMDGHDSTNPVNIYLKPSSTGYTGDYVGADGVNLVAFGTVNSPRALAFNPVIITGSYTHPNGAKAIVQGIRFVADATEAVIQEGGELALSDCQFELDNSAVAIQFEEANNKTLVLNNVSTIGDGISLDSDGSACDITIFQEACDFSSTSQASLSYTGNLRLEAYSVAYEHSFSINTTTATVRVFDSSISTGDSFAFDFGAGTTGGFEANNVSSNAAPLVRCQNAAMIPSSTYCVGTDISGSSFVSFQQTRGGTWKNVVDNYQIYSQSRTGYRGSEHHSRQAYIQTTNDVPTTLFALPVAELEAVTFQGMIIGSTSDKKAAIGGNFLITARRESEGNVVIVGSPVTNVNSSDTNVFAVEADAPSQSVRIRVVGKPGVTYNWNSHFEFIKMLDNT